MDMNPFSVRRWIYVPQVPDRRNYQFAVSTILHPSYYLEMRFFEYGHLVVTNEIKYCEISDVLAMLDMYDGITLIREDDDK
jgi:hypothetical protein